jgi:hypothetical protein
MVSEYVRQCEEEYRRYKEYTMANELKLDYITLVSSELGELTRIFLKLTEGSRDAARAYTSDPRDSAWSCEGIYLGKMPRQPRHAGAMLQVPGAMAEKAALLLDDARGVLHVSRFDLQVTIPIENAPHPKDLYSVLSKPEEYPWQQPGKPPRVTLLTNSEGGETIYIGSRTSDIMQRVYIKELEGRHYVRYEIECKGRLARALDEQGILLDKDVQATFARSVLAGMPGEAQQLTMPFRDKIGEGKGQLVRSGYRASEEATMQWYATTVIPSLKRAMEGRFKDEVIAVFESHGIAIAPKVHDAITNRIDKRQKQGYTETV